MAPRDLILVFTRFPVPGKVKTRTIPAIGPEGAARLHRRMTEHAVDTVRSLPGFGSERDVGIRVYYTGATRKQFRSWLGADLSYSEQSPGDIGDRMRNAFEAELHGGAERVLAVGTDIPDLSAAILQKAFIRLNDHDVVMGPAGDGGYYLIGMKKIYGDLFRGIDWGSERVCRQTREAMRRLGLNYTELESLQDLDCPGDLVLIRKDARLHSAIKGNPAVSVIIPTLNEEKALDRTLKRLSREEKVEIIVADGGSGDRTREIAAGYGARTLKVSGGRAAQQNAGAEASKGELLLFLHADTLPPENFMALMRRTLDNPSTVAGAFRLRTDSTRTLMRVIEWSAYVRSSLFQLPYGDQGLFMEKRVFDEEGGFAPLPIMEDYELVRRLRRRGRIVTLSEPALVSARRWERLGILRTTLINQMMVAAFLVKVPTHRLARFYRKTR